VRSMNTSLSNAGNLGFKRDLTNQGDRAIATVLDLVQTGALGSDAARMANDSARNYSATLLPSNAQGLPTALVSDVAFASAGVAGNDIAVATMGVTLRYVVDRLCINTGLADPSHCTMNDNQVPMGGNGGGGAIAEDPTGGSSGAVPQQVVYRLSIRVDGPRQTQAFFQTTFTL
jgi:type IV pilus assembly protein PilX